MKNDIVSYDTVKIELSKTKKLLSLFKRKRVVSNKCDEMSGYPNTYLTDEEYNSLEEKIIKATIDEIEIDIIIDQVNQESIKRTKKM